MTAEDDEFSLDDARERLYTLQRASERHSAELGKIVEALNSKKETDEWLLKVLDEAAKGVAFHEQQLVLFSTLHSRASEYIDGVRQEANELAMAELSGRRGDEQEHGAGDGVAAAGLPLPALDGGVAAAAASSSSTPVAGASRRKSSKTVHPELQKFKLEKQAKILGRYGGIPALGAGLVLPRLQRDSILKATGSPAAREIHYSKVENKDATNLAEVMRFKVRKSEEGGGPGGGAPALSPWQSELSTKKGKTALDGTDAKDLVTPSTRSHAAYGEELGEALQQRQAALEAAMAAERAAAATPAGSGAGPHISADAMDELADKLRRRQSVAQQVEAEAAAAAAEAAEAAAPPAAPSWSNTTAPFGGELTAALLRRAEQRQVAAAAAAGEGSGQPSGGAAEGRAAESTAGERFAADAAEGRAATASGGGEGQGGEAAAAAAAAAATAAAAAASTSGQQAAGNPSMPFRLPPPPPSATAGPATPVLGLVTPTATAPRRSAPPVPMGTLPMGSLLLGSPSPPGGLASAAAGSSELQEKLLRRRSAVESPTQPSPSSLGVPGGSASGL